MQDDHPYDMVDTETASYSIVIHTIQGLVQDQTRYYYGEKRITSHGGIPSSYTLFFYTSGRRYKLGHIPRVTQDDRRHS